MNAAHKLFLIILVMTVLIVPITAQTQIQDPEEDSADVADLSQEPTFSNMLVTHYNTASEEDFSTWYSGARPAPDRRHYCAIPIPQRGFYEDVKCEGSGLGTDGKIYRYSTIRPTKSASPGISDPRFSRGKTATSTNPTAHRTIAVDSRKIPRGATVYISFDRYASSNQQCAQQWNGCYVAEDAGSAITGNHIDLYVGVGRRALQESSCLPSHADIWLTNCQPGVGEGGIIGLGSTQTDIAPVAPPEQPLQQAITGTYVVKPSFSSPFYVLTDYKKILEKGNILSQSCAGQNINCINENLNLFNQNSHLLWKLGSCENEGERGILNDFKEQFEDCNSNTENSDCLCEVSFPQKNRNGDYTIHLKKQSPSTLIEVGNKQSTLPVYSPLVSYSSENQLQTQEWNDINIKLQYQRSSLSNSWIEWYQGNTLIGDYTIAYDTSLENNRLFLLKRSNPIATTIADPSNNEIKNYPRCTSNKQKYRFCVKNQLNGLDYKFALDFTSTSPPISPQIEAFDYVKGSNSIVVKFSKVAGSQNYKLYYIKENERNNLFVSGITLDPSTASRIENVQNNDPNQPILEANKLYEEVDGKYVYLLTEVENNLPTGTNYVISISSLNQHGETPQESRNTLISFSQ